MFKLKVTHRERSPELKSLSVGTSVPSQISRAALSLRAYLRTSLRSTTFSSFIFLILFIFKVILFLFNALSLTFTILKTPFLLLSFLLLYFLLYLSKAEILSWCSQGGIYFEDRANILRLGMTWTAAFFLFSALVSSLFFYLQVFL